MRSTPWSRTATLMVLLHCSITGASRLLAADERTFAFDDVQAGSLPPGWTAAKTGEGPGSDWKVVADDTAPSGKNVLAQTSSEGPNPLYNVCVADGTAYRDLDLAVSYKSISGKLDQGGGVVWRYKDRNNYYIARYNPLETNYRVYKVVDGKRTQLDTAVVNLPSGEWQTLRITQQGHAIRCYLQGKLVLEAEDGTFTDAGQIGVWSKADAVTHFDDLRVQALN